MTIESIARLVDQQALIDAVNSLTAFDIRTFGGVCDGVADDTTAMMDVINAANARALEGFAPVVMLPAGITQITTAGGLPKFERGVRVQGAREYGSYVRMAQSFAGDLFSWSEAWFASNSADADQFFPNATAAGGGIRDLTLLGHRQASGQQNAIMLYDRIDAFHLENVSCFRVRGRCLASGLTLNASQAYIRESVFNNFRTSGCGLAGVPCVEFNSTGVGDSSNSIQCRSWNIYGSYGPGLIIRNGNSAGANPFLRDMVMVGLRIEGFEASTPNSNADLFQLGDATLAGGISNLDIKGMRLISPPSGFFAMRVRAPNATAGGNINNSEFQGSIGAGQGGGLNVQAGRSLMFWLREIATSGTDVTIGSATAGVGTPIHVNGYGAEATWSWSIDATTLDNVRCMFPVYGNPSVAAAAAGTPANFTATNIIPVVLKGAKWQMAGRTAAW